MMISQNPFRKAEKEYREFMPPTEVVVGKQRVIVHSVIPADVTDEQFKDFVIRTTERLIMNAYGRELQGKQ